LNILGDLSQKIGHRCFFLQRNISMNTAALKIPGSPIGTSAPGNRPKFFYGDNLNVLPTSGAGGSSGGNENSTVSNVYGNLLVQSEWLYDLF
jgi:hypothetical protein